MFFVTNLTSTTNSSGVGFFDQLVAGLVFSGTSAANVVATISEPNINNSSPFSNAVVTTPLGSGTQVVVNSGSGQQAQVGSSFANPIVVTVLDASNKPVSGATVFFFSPGVGAGATFTAAAPTNASGQTQVTATANGAAGSYAVDVYVTSGGYITSTGTGFTIFSLTNLPIGIGDVRNGQWFLSNDGTSFSHVSNWGTSTDIAVTGDWLKTTAGHGKIGVWRPSSGEWFLSSNDTNYISNSASNIVYISNWGAPGDIPVVGDWTGSGQTEVGVFRPSTGEWFLDKDNTPFISTTATNIIYIHDWGTSGDMPVVGDWAATGTDSIGVWRPSTGNWYLHKTAVIFDNSSYISDNAANIVPVFGWGSGAVGDRPVVGDWDGSGFTEVGVWRPGSGEWFLDLNNTAYVSNTAPNIDYVSNFGEAGDQPIVGAWFGQPSTITLPGFSKIGVYRPSSGIWYLSRNNSSFGTGMDTITVQGVGSSPSDIAVVGNWA
jgi:hypothetical protein